MASYMRLRQICLVAPHLEPVISDIAAIMGLSECYRDGNVAKYGLENALLPVDTILLELVAPVVLVAQHEPRVDHLRILRECGLVVDRRAGRWVHYAVAEPVLASCKLLLYELEPLRR